MIVLAERKEHSDYLKNTKPATTRRKIVIYYKGILKNTVRPLV